MLEFLYPFALLGVLSAAVPLALHLTGGRTAVPAELPTLRFILATNAEARLRHRIRQLLLLLTRMLLLALLFFAAAGPRLTGTRFGERPELSGTVIMAIDGSVSMLHNDPDGRRFDKAVLAAKELLDDLDPEARVGLLNATSPTERLVTPPTIDHDLVRRLLSEIQPRPAAATLAETLEEAADMGMESGGSGTELTVFVFTDIAGRFADPEAVRKISGKIRREHGGLQPKVVMINVSSGRPVNGAITSVKVSPLWGMPGTRLSITARVLPPAGARQVEVGVTLGGNTVRRVTVDVPEDLRSGERFECRLEAIVPLDGADAGAVFLTAPDRLPLDDARAFILHRIPAMNVLVIDGEPDFMEGRGVSLYLRAMLEAAGRLDEEHLGIARSIRLKVISREELPAENPADYTHVILADVGGLSEPVWGKIRQYVETGGNLILWCGPRTSPADLEPVAARRNSPRGGLLPATGFSRKKLDAPAGLVLTPSPVGGGGRKSLLDFSRLARLRSLFGEVRVEEIALLGQAEQAPAVQTPSAGLNSTAGIGSQVFLRLSSGQTVGVIRRYGEGSVTLFALPPTPEYSDWPLHGGTFVALNMELLRQTRGVLHEVLRLPLGTTTSVPIPAGARPLRLFRRRLDSPAGAAETESVGGAEVKPALSASGEILPVLSLDSMNLLPPSEPGAYRFTLEAAGEKEPIIQDVVYELPAGESDLSPFSEDALEELRQAGILICSNTEQAVEKVTGSRRVAPLTGAALLLLLLLAGLESWMTATMYHDKVVVGEARLPSGQAAGRNAPRTGEAPEAFDA